MSARLTDEELYRIGPSGLEDIGDDTLTLRLNEAEQRALRHDAVYRDAVAEEMLATPEAA